ncbi:hypothetical protein [Vitreimonas flagellata]|uniref:hypothetical protein n=1 Tax=Vitreimonas flagellata TaxID=2560861 RepID=UPI001075539B|nr:hypothetical protein [Vitreimonas flagellata]
MDKPDPPKAPDPAKVAQAQTASNEQTARTEAALNRVNQITPYGNVTYSNVGDKWTQTVTESDPQRQLREGQEQTGIALNEMSSEQIGRVRDILGTNFNPSSYSTRADMGGQLDMAEALGGDFDASRFDPTGGGLDLSRFDPSGAANLDLSRFDPSQALGDFGQQIEEDQFNLASGALDKAFDRGEESLRTRMANQGLQVGGEAFDDEMEGFNVAKGQAYTNARLAARDAALASRGQKADELAAGAGLSAAERDDWLRRMETGAGFESIENADELARLTTGFDQSMASRNAQMAELLNERQVNAAEGEADYARDYATELARRQVPLSEIISIMSGTPLTPINPGTPASSNVANTDVLGANRLAYDANANNYNQAMAGRNAIIGGLFSLGGAALGSRGG